MIIYINYSTRMWYLKDIVFKDGSYDFDWTVEKDDARKFQTRNDAWDYLHPIRNIANHFDSNWHIVESLKGKSGATPAVSKDDAYDHAMGIL